MQVVSTDEQYEAITDTGHVVLVFSFDWRDRWVSAHYMTHPEFAKLKGDWGHGPAAAMAWLDFYDHLNSFNILGHKRDIPFEHFCQKFPFWEKDAAVSRFREILETIEGRFPDVLRGEAFGQGVPAGKTIVKIWERPDKSQPPT